MKAYLLYLWDALRGSYWFLPSVCAVAAIALALIMPEIDGRVSSSAWQLPEAIRTTTQAARATLSAIASAMMGVTGTVFSITVVTLSLASQQFGPRLLRRFMLDLTTQATLGSFLATGFYCLLVLRIVEQGENGPTAANFSVLAAVVLALFSMGMLIVFIHHIAMLIQAPQVIAAVAGDLDDAIVRLFPEKMGEPAHADQNADKAAQSQEATLGAGVVLHATSVGYIQAIDGAGLIHLARSHGVLFRLLRRPGDFIAGDSPLAELWRLDDEVDSTPLDRLAETIQPRLDEHVLVGVRRTPRQDVECAVTELVEVAVRALSPGVNDPFSAINCVDRLGAALASLAERTPPSPYRLDEEGRLRLIARGPSFSSVLDAAFNQIRQCSGASVAVAIRLLEAYRVVAAKVRTDEDRAAVRRHAATVLRLSERFPEELDRRDVLKRYDAVKALLGEKRSSESAR